MEENLLGKFVADEVAAAERDYRGFRDRATSAVTVAGGLVAVLAGLLALAAGDQKNLLPPSGKPWLALSMALLVGSALIGLAIQAPAKLKVADERALVELVENNWTDEAWDKSIAELQAKYLIDLRTANDWASKLFFALLIAQFLAIIALAVLSWQIFAFLT